MPCYSRIETKLTNFARLITAARESGFGFTITQSGLRLTVESGGSSMIYSRSTESDPFILQPSGSMAIHEKLCRKYAEIGVKAWANRTGHSIVKNDGRKIQLINRRG